jgi:hypothetical protein
MDYGLAAYSTVDDSIIISSDTKNAFYMGKPTFIGTTFGPYDSFYGGTQYQISYHHFRITGSGLYVPIMFSTVPTGAYIDVGSVHYVSPYWYVTIISKGAGYATVPEVYAFVSSEEYAATTPSEGYGMQLRNSAGELTFDSRWGKKLLVIDDVADYTLVDGSSATIPSMAKPAVAFSAKYLDFVGVTGEYAYAYSMGLNISGTVATIGNVKSGFMMFLFNGSSFIFWSGFYTAPDGYIPQTFDWTDYDATYNAGVAGTAPIIDGTYYD